VKAIVLKKKILLDILAMYWLGNVSNLEQACMAPIPIA